MKVLSLFDGIACGRLALERAGISVEFYCASEIEPASITVAKTNNPDVVHVGDIRVLSFNDGTLRTANSEIEVGEIDLVIGGSPCTDFSSIGYANGMKSGKEEILSLPQYLNLKSVGMKFDGQSYLFWEYVRLLEEVKPKFFLLENVVMAKKWQAVIDKTMGIGPILINSSLVSAQNRPRLYWTNIPDIRVPEDRHISLDDVLDEGASKEDVSSCQTVRKSFPRLMSKYGYIPERFNAYNASAIKEKACALSRGSMVTSSCATLLFVPVSNGVHLVKDGILDDLYPVRLEDGRYNLRKLSFLEMERLQTLPDGYTEVDGIGKQKRGSIIGNCWTVDAVSYLLSFINRTN